MFNPQLHYFHFYCQLSNFFFFFVTIFNSHISVHMCHTSMMAPNDFQVLAVNNWAAP